MTFSLDTQRMASLGPDSTLVVTDSHTTATVDGEVVILNNEKGLYQGLDGVGPQVWELLQEPMTVREVRDAILQEYDVDRERCERDLVAFLEALVADELVEIENAAA